MARAGIGYPQVELGASALVTSRVVACPPECRVASALRRARLASADVVLVGNRRAVRRRDLERLVGWGLTRLRAIDAAWHRLPVVSSRAPEIEVRRLLMGGAPIVLVREGRRATGAIDGEVSDVVRPPLSLAHRLDIGESRAGEGRLGLLRRAGEIGGAAGVRVFAVGGFARDLLLGRVAPDLDLLVEGDGAAFARRLAREIGGTLAVHDGFATASIEGAVDPSGMALGRIDIASARHERYERPGALPTVSAATAEVDFRRRDFSVNALALALRPTEFGRLLDPVGGEPDVNRRRLRLLHPLSFVEDPTRIFRAARYASRLGFRLDADGFRALRLAREVGDYPALSGRRLRAELDSLAGESTGWNGLELLVRWKALTIWDREYLASPRILDKIRAGRRLSTWAVGVNAALPPGEVALIALLADQRRAVVARCLARLGVTGEPLRQLFAAATAAPLARRLDGGHARLSDVAETLRPLSAQMLVGAWLHGGRRARRRIEWFMTRGRRVRPLLSGGDVVALGVPRGPAVGECLEALRRLRLDGRVKTEDQERAFAAAWRRDGEMCALPPARGGRRVHRKRGSL